MRPKGKRSRFHKGWILLGIMALALLGWSALQHPYVRGRIHDRVASAIRSQLGLRADLGPMTLELPFRIVARSIVLDHPEHGTLASAGSLILEPSLWALLRGELELARIQIEGAYVRLRIEDGKIVNLPTLHGATTDDGRPSRLPLEELIVRRAKLVVDAAPLLSGSLEQLSAVARVTDGTRISLQLSVGKGQLVHELGREEVQSALLSARIAPDGLEIDSFDIKTSLLTLGVRKGKLALPVQHGRYQAHVELASDLGRLAALPHGLDLPPVDGAVSASFELSGAGSDYHARGHLSAQDPHLDGFGFGQLELEIDATPSEVALLPGSEGHIIENGGVVELSGKLGLSETLPLEVEAKIEGLVFQKLMAQLDVTQDCIVDWHLRGGFKIAGTANPIDINGPIWADHLSFRTLDGPYHDPASKEVIGTPAGHVAGRVAIRPDALRFENLRGTLPHSEMLVTVHVGFDERLGVVATSDALDLRDATHLVGMQLAGAGKFSLDVAGTYSDPTLTGTLDLQGFEIDGFRVGHIKTRAVMEQDGRAVRFSDTSVKKNDTSYVIHDLLLDFTEHFAIDASARFDRLTLADFYHTVLLDDDADFASYQGVVSGDARARYSFGFEGDDADGTLAVDVDLDVESAKVHGVPFGRGRAEGRWTFRHISEGARGAELELSELHLTKGGGAVHASGRMGLGATLNMTVFAEELALRDFVSADAVTEALNGELNAVGTLRGTLERPEAGFDAELIGAAVGDRALGDLRTYVKLTHQDDPWIRAAKTWTPKNTPANETCARARSGFATAVFPGSSDVVLPEKRAPALAYVVCGGGFDGKIDLDLALGIADGTPVRGRMLLRELPMAWLFRRPKRTEAPITGALSASIDVHGGFLERPDSLLGLVTIGHFRLGQDQAFIQADGPATLHLTGRGARIERARFIGNGSVLSVAGGASLESGLSTQLHGDVDLAALSALLPGVSQSSGRVAVDVRVTGQAKNPKVFGRATLQGGSLLLVGYPQPLQKVSASLSFSEREILLEKLEGDVAGGRVSVTGSAALSENRLSRYELFLTGRNISLEPEPGVQVAFSADTRLTYQSGARLPLLTGTLRLERVRYERSFSLGIAERLSGLSQAKRISRETYDPELDRLAFDLTVVENTPLRINNNLITAELRIEDSERPFKLVGTDQRTGVIGTLELTRGTLRFRNTEFAIQDGTVRFDDPAKVSPRLDVHARTEFRRTADASGARWLISLHAYGDSDDLRLETSSDPALAQEDIALLLTAGLTRAEAERLGTGELTGGAALEALASVTGVDREVKRALPVIDDFAVTSAYSVRSGRTEPQVVVGKRLSDRVRASATTGLSAESNFKTGVEWRFDDQTSVEAAYDNVQTTTSSQFGNVGVDLRWRLEFD